eukprot:3720666-Pleurochrysis_carterae.AAC.7
MTPSDKWIGGSDVVETLSLIVKAACQPFTMQCASVRCIAVRSFYRHESRVLRPASRTANDRSL